MTKNDFIAELNICRSKQWAAQNSLDALIERLELEYNIELSDTNCTVGNCFSIDEAIQGYVQNEEDFDAESIWNDIMDEVDGL